MAEHRGKIQGWITKNGQHIPIYENYTAERAPKVKQAKFKASRQNAVDIRQLKTREDVYEVVMGSDYKKHRAGGEEYERALTDAQTAWREMDELDEEIKQVREELKPETIIPTTEEMPGFTRWEREMFAEYTEKGEELNERLTELRSKKNEAEKQHRKATDTIRRYDEQAYEQEKADWKGTFLVPTKKTEDDFPGFELDTTISYYEDLREKGQAHVVEMSPKEYLERCAYQVFDTSLERTLRAVDPEAVQKYAAMMNSGTKFHMPMLNLADKEQEGRHRAVTAIVNGIEKIPVLVVPKKRRSY